MNTVGERLKFIIDDKHLSQSTFGDLTDTPRQSISNYVNNQSKPGYEFLCKLFYDFKVNLNWLIVGEGDPYIANNEPADLNEIKQAILELVKNKELTLDDFK